MLDYQPAPPTNPKVPVNSNPNNSPKFNLFIKPENNWTQVDEVKQNWFQPVAGGGGTKQSEGFIAYLSNIPEKAQSANLLGALRKLLGPFRPRNLLKINCGTCKVILEDKETRDRLLTEPFDIFGTIIKVSLEPTMPGEAWPSVYIGGLPPQTTVGQLLGAIRKTIGEFQASNKLVITNGFSMIRFKTEEQQMRLLCSGLAICSVPVMLSKHPFPGVGPGLGMNRGLGQFIPPGGPFMQRGRVGGVFNGQVQAPVMPVGFNVQEQATPMSVDALELINKRLRSRARYLEEQIAMYEERFAKLQAPVAAAPGFGAYNVSMW